MIARGETVGCHFATEIELTSTIGRQLLVSDQTANILPNFLAIFLGIAAQCLFNVLRRILIKLFPKPGKVSPKGSTVSDHELGEVPGNANQTSAPTGDPRFPNQNGSTPGQDHNHGERAIEPALANPRRTDNGGIDSGHGGTVHDSPYHNDVERSHDAGILTLRFFRTFLSQIHKIVPIQQLDTVFIRIAF